MILVADNLQITNPNIETAINQMDPLPIQELVKKCESAGAQAIDIIPGPLTREPEKKMTFLVEAVQSETRLPMLLGFPVQIIAGISNLTTGKIPKDKKRLLERSFLLLIAASGLSMALLNVFHSQTMQTARACEALLSPGIFSWTNI